MKKAYLKDWFLPIIKDYRSVLKPLPIEALPDLIIYRPMAFVLVRALKKLPVTPNQVSFFAVVMGVTAAVFVAKDTEASFKVAGILYFLTVILDCSDGMLASAKGLASPFGRIVDGVGDYIYGLALFTSLAIVFRKHNFTIFYSPLLSALIMLISMVLQAMMVDYQRNQYKYHVLGDNSIPEQDIKKFSAELKNLDTQGYLVRYFIRLYIFYSRIQTFFAPRNMIKYQPDQYHKANVWTLRVWLNIDQSTHYTILIISLLCNNLRLFVYYNLIFANILLVVMIPGQYLVNKGLVKVSLVGSNE